eukprot:UN26566
MGCLSSSTSVSEKPENEVDDEEYRRIKRDVEAYQRLQRKKRKELLDKENDVFNELDNIDHFSKASKARVEALSWLSQAIASNTELDGRMVDLLWKKYDKNDDGILDGSEIKVLLSEQAKAELNIINRELASGRIEKQLQALPNGAEL